MRICEQWYSYGRIYILHALVVWIETNIHTFHGYQNKKDCVSNNDPVKTNGKLMKWLGEKRWHLDKNGETEKEVE